MYLIIAEFSDFRLCFYWTACSSQGQRTICQFVNLCDILPSSPQFFETDTDTIKNWKKFETEMSHSALKDEALSYCGDELTPPKYIVGQPSCTNCW